MRHATLALFVTSLCVASAAHGQAVQASSELTLDDTTHSAEHAFDGLMSTGWAEAEDDAGQGSWVELRLSRPDDIVSVSVWPGRLSEGKQSLKAWARPRKLTVTLSGASPEPITKTVVLEDGAEVGPQRVDVPVRGRARTVRITVDEVYEGIVHPEQLFLTEVGLNFADGQAHPWVGKVASWVIGDEGVRPRDKHEARIAELYEQASGDDDEAAREALGKLMSHAGDGPSYVRRWVARYVPLGYRVHAIPPSEPAVEALLKLRDPNAIPALEQAAVRSKGHDHEQLSEQVEMFYAYQELIGGPDTNVPNWGQTGWAVGELRSFGEPLQIEVDQQGQIYVADIGNSRVQRFSDSGRVGEVWGADEPDIAEAWLGDGRTWYVSGSDPGDQSGQFVNPLDIAIIPGKFADGFAVLDATGRVQVFDSEGALQTSFTAPVHNFPLLDGVGGQAYLVHAKDELVVIWTDAAFVYDLEGDEITHFDITDGVPSGATVLKNRKLGLIFGDELVMYSTDGFRHGSILGDTLGQGFEAWDVALDQDRKLWAVTDTGHAVKYKRPGKVDYEVQLTTDPVSLPRIAVRDDVIYVTTTGDEVQVFDALKLHREAELADEGS